MRALQGGGADPGASPRHCATCGGTGRKVTTRGEGSFQYRSITVCPDCGGRGTIIDKPCLECGGTGQTREIENLTVRIPAGAEDGMALRIAARSLAGSEPGGSPGDLLVLIASEPDARFSRRGADLWREVLGVTEAVLGAQLTVPTLEGPVQVTVPAGTQPREVLRLRGKGLPEYGTSRRGDLNLRVEVRIPDHLTEQERELISACARWAEAPNKADAVRGVWVCLIRTDSKHRWNGAARLAPHSFGG